MTPEQFESLKIEGKGGMKDTLRSFKLRVGGKKAELINRYQEWYEENKDLAQNEAITEPTAQAAPMLPRLLKKERTKISNATRKCVHELSYEPAARFLAKTSEKDLSSLLYPAQYFVQIFATAIQEMTLKTSPGSNEITLRSMIVERIPQVQAVVELAPFFENWSIQVSTQDPNHETREGLSDELDIINSALEHRILRWTKGFPRAAITDQLWPTTYTEQERIDIRKYVMSYMEQRNLFSEFSEETDESAIEELQDAADFPVPMGRTKPVIKAVMKDCRAMMAKRKKKQSIHTEDANNNDGDVADDATTSRKRRSCEDVPSMNSKRANIKTIIEISDDDDD